MKEQQDDDHADQPFKLAVNLCVLVLNWLHLRRPGVAPPEILLGKRLSKVQWRIVRQREIAMRACKDASPVFASDMAAQQDRGVGVCFG